MTCEEIVQTAGSAAANASPEEYRTEELRQGLIAAYERAHLGRLERDGSPYPSIMQRFSRLERDAARQSSKMNELDESMKRLNMGMDKLLEGMNELKEGIMNQKKAVQESEGTAQNPWAAQKEEMKSWPTEVEVRKARIDAYVERLKYSDLDVVKAMK